MMDARSIIGESTDAIVVDDSPTEDKEILQTCQSRIPVVSLCPPDGSVEAQLTVIPSAEELCDSCSSLGRPSSSFQLYHQRSGSEIRRQLWFCPSGVLSWVGKVSLAARLKREQDTHQTKAAPCGFSKGFQPRGTYIGVRLSSLSKLQQETGPGKTLSAVPQQLSKSFSRSGVVSRDSNGSQFSSRGRIKRMLAADFSLHTFLCDAPGERFAQLVYRSETSASLWSLKAIHAMCEMEQSRIRSQAQFQDLCQQSDNVEAEGTPRSDCSPSWSLGNYLAVLSNVSCCLSLTSQQSSLCTEVSRKPDWKTSKRLVIVSESLNLLRKCAPSYHRGDLIEACAERPKHGGCSSVPFRSLSWR
ncbi:hypothetical protein CRENBAI_022958 [Crenichthys baileyi]|uniref:Uncharacterized protein n=1 Tax=Crenichthys baileyi TaxID=28760 RepID=A0AAV9RL74_9TELE